MLWSLPFGVPFRDPYNYGDSREISAEWMFALLESLPAWNRDLHVGAVPAFAPRRYFPGMSASELTPEDSILSPCSSRHAVCILHERVKPDPWNYCGPKGRIPVQRSDDLLLPYSLP